MTSNDSCESRRTTTNRRRGSRADDRLVDKIIEAATEPLRHHSKLSWFFKRYIPRTSEFYLDNRGALKVKLTDCLKEFNSLKVFDEPTKNVLRTPFLFHAAREASVAMALDRLSAISAKSLALSLAGGFAVAIYVSKFPGIPDAWEIVKWGLMVLGMYAFSLVVALVLPACADRWRWRLRGPRYLIVFSLGTMVNGIGVVVAISHFGLGDAPLPEAYIGGTVGAIIFVIATVLLLNVVRWVLVALIGKENLRCPQSAYVMALHSLLLLLDGNASEPIESHRREELVVGLERAARALSDYPRPTRGMDLSTDIAVRTQRDRVVAAIRRKKTEILWPGSDSFEAVRTWIIESFRMSVAGHLREMKGLQPGDRKNMLREDFATLATKSLWSIIVGAAPLALTIAYQDIAGSVWADAVIPEDVYRYAVSVLVLWLVVSIIIQLDPSFRDKLEATQGIASLFKFRRR